MTSSDSAFTFSTFVVGASNRLAVSAALAVAGSPGHIYNPLFIYGESGRGKTHLVNAIAQKASESRHDTVVVFSSGEDIAAELNSSIGSGERHKFLERFQQADLLIIDDVQFLTGQRETQTELLRLLNILLRDGQQLVFTSDRQPSDIPDVDQRLLSRLSGGLVVDVGAPDYEMRLAILRNVSSDRAMEFADGVLEEVARLPFANVRELKGALNRISASQQLEGVPISPGDVLAVLGERRSGGSAGVDRVNAIIPDGADYEGFLAGVLEEVENHIEPWRVRLGEAVARWHGEGFNVAVLERAMALPTAPDVDGLLGAFSKAVERLRDLERQACSIDPTAAGNPAFRDPEGIAAAQMHLREIIVASLALPAADPMLTRDRFIANIGNQLALRAADAVVAEPGSKYNPLLIHGPRRSGKSHLAHAIANEMRQKPARPVTACLSAAAFVSELVVAMQEGSVERWRQRYRAADVVVLDDVQDLVGKERSQDELFHLFNFLVDHGRQIVLTSNEPPHELTGLAARLRSRFEGGLVVGLPARERTRMDQLAEREPGELDRFFEDGEKTIWQWPESGGRLIEDYR